MMAPDKISLVLLREELSKVLTDLKAKFELLVLAFRELLKTLSAVYLFKSSFLMDPSELGSHLGG